MWRFFVSMSIESKDFLQYYISVHQEALNQIGVPLLIVDPSGRISHANTEAATAWTQLQGAGASLVGIDSFELLDNPGDRSHVRDSIINAAQKSNAGPYLCPPTEMVIFTRNGGRRFLDVRTKSLQTLTGEPAGYTLTIDDRTIDKIETVELRMQTYVDPLTRLPNRRRLEERLSDAFHDYTRYDNPFSFIIGDIDAFKAYNDQLGHQAGDERLQEIAMVVAGSVRDTDLSARWGGEEFAFVLPHTDRQGARIIAHRLLDSMRTKITTSVDNPAIGASMSFGIATLPTDADSVPMLIRVADEALYKAKEAGKNCAVVASTGEIIR